MLLMNDKYPEANRFSFCSLVCVCVFHFLFVTSVSLCYVLFGSILCEAYTILHSLCECVLFSATSTRHTIMDLHKSNLIIFLLTIGRYDFVKLKTNADLFGWSEKTIQ